MPRTTLTRKASRRLAPRQGRGPGRLSADPVQHALRLGLRRAARRGEHLAKEVAGAVLVADALELLGELELARERIAVVVAVGQRGRRGVALISHRDRLVEVEGDAGE